MQVKYGILIIKYYRGKKNDEDGEEEEEKWEKNMNGTIYKRSSPEWFSISWIRTLTIN